MREIKLAEKLARKALKRKRIIKGRDLMADRVKDAIIV